MPVRLSSPGLLWRGRQESLLKKGGLPPPPPPSSRKLFFRSRWKVPAAIMRGEKALPRRSYVRRKARDVPRHRQGDSADEQGFSFLCPALSPPFPADVMRLSAPYVFCHSTQKAPFSGSFFMRCRFRTERSQQKQGWRGGRDFRRRAATAVRAVPRSCRGLAPADNTRGGWDGRTGSNGAPPAPAATAWPPQP